MPANRVTFPGALGDRLSARLELPSSGRPRATALFAHCFTCSKDLRAAVALTRELANAGFAVLRFDFTGLGESEGDFGETDFTSNVDDLVAAARWLESRHGAPSLLVGHSLGGAAVLCAKASLPSVRAIATIGAPADPAHVLEHVAEKEEEIRSTGEAIVTLAGRPFTVRASFLDDLEAAIVGDSLADLHAALLVMHSPVDPTVGIENARRIYDAARHPKSFVSLDTADHLLSDRADAEYAARVLGVWAGRYVPDAVSRGGGTRTRMRSTILSCTSTPGRMATRRASASVGIVRSRTNRRPWAGRIAVRRPTSICWPVSEPARPSRSACRRTARGWALEDIDVRPGT